MNKIKIIIYSLKIFKKLVFLKKISYTRLIKSSSKAILTLPTKTTDCSSYDCAESRHLKKLADLVAANKSLSQSVDSTKIFQSDMHYKSQPSSTSWLQFHVIPIKMSTSKGDIIFQGHNENEQGLYKRAVQEDRILLTSN